MVGGWRASKFEFLYDVFVRREALAEAKSTYTSQCNALLSNSAYTEHEGGDTALQKRLDALKQGYYDAIEAIELFFNGSSRMEEALKVIEDSPLLMRGEMALERAYWEYGENARVMSDQIRAMQGKKEAEKTQVDEFFVSTG